MTNKDLGNSIPTTAQSGVRIIRHAKLCKKLDISSAKLFDMCAKDLFPKPFKLVPGGRAVGWIEHEADAWILARQQAAMAEAE